MTTTIPAITADARGQAISEHDRRRDVGSRPATLLLVEDDKDLLFLFQLMLTTAGYRVITATDGDSGLRMLMLHPEVDALVSDVVMPNGISGVKLAQEARKLQPALPVLLMSGYSREELGRVDDLADIPFMAKPFRHGALESHVARLLSR